MVEEKIENILNAQPIKYYPNKEDAQRVLRERNARLAGQISQLFEPKRECIYCPKPADGAMLIMGNLMAHPNCVIQKLNELLDPDYDGSEEPVRIVGDISQRNADAQWYEKGIEFIEDLVRRARKDYLGLSDRDKNFLQKLSKAIWNIDKAIEQVKREAYDFGYAKAVKDNEGMIERVKRDIFNKTVQAAEHRERFVIERTRRETDTISYAKGVLDGIKKGRQETAKEILEYFKECHPEDWENLEARFEAK